ncbi:SMI1/KNR4 family protein SUKH-1 [Propionicimonas paludicola]|uniref:SMI1/KNR4 family protein SUKH-1 n=1 Tax=Propionicimonas paludicola TaxID=185243 RepID=A0A2A9CX75_9ACTN|nr:SMI1/KNR4 family protein [Propionicimonas paludicola]PFG18179.1 SMI1/KNR4 family protein SUKH-1 [Propionicimonas paludicola]
MSVQETVHRLVLDWEAAVLDGLDEDERVPSILRAPASAEAIAALEERLGRTLPPSYRAFLELTDGAITKPGWDHILLPSNEGDDAGLLTTGQVGWLRDKSPDTVEIWSDGPESNLPDEVYFDYSRTQDCVQLKVSHLPHLLQISCFEWESAILLNPLACQSDGEWEAWSFDVTDPGAFRYRSFADLLRADTTELRKRHAQEIAEASGYIPGLESAFAELDARTDDAAVNRHWEIRQLQDPQPWLHRLIALTDHPHADVRSSVWSAIARVPTTEALEAVLGLVHTESDEWVIGSVMTRLATDPDPRAHQAGVDLLSRGRIAYTVYADQAGLDLLWDAWLLHDNPECLERLVGCGDPRATEPARALLVDASTPADRIERLVSAASRPRDPSLAQAVSAVAQQGRVDVSSALSTLMQMGALDEALALITPAMLDDAEQGEMWRGWVEMIEKQRR